MSCCVVDCARPHRARGYCVLHYSRARASGELGLKYESDESRILAYIVPTGFCWEWASVLNKAGYGTTKAGTRTWLAHRWVYEYLVGPIPEGLALDHLCRVRHCVNPDHLEPVTRQENVRRGLVFNGLCNRGHALEGSNIWWDSKARTVRRCRKCRTEYLREYRKQLKLKEAA